MILKTTSYGLTVKSNNNDNNIKKQNTYNGLPKTNIMILKYKIEERSKETSEELSEENLEFHAVPKSELNNKRALLCFMMSLSRESQGKERQDIF